MVIKRSLIKLGQHLQPPWSQSPGRKCQVKQSLLSRLAELIKFSLNIQRGKWISFSWRALPPPLSFEIYFHHVYLQEKKTDGQNIHSQASNESLGIGPWTFRGPLSMHGWGFEASCKLSWTLKDREQTPVLRAEWSQLWLWNLHAWSLILNSIKSSERSEEGKLCHGY